MCSLGLHRETVWHSGDGPEHTLGSKWLLVGRPGDPLGIFNGSLPGVQDTFCSQNGAQISHVCTKMVETWYQKSCKIVGILGQEVLRFSTTRAIRPYASPLVILLHTNLALTSRATCPCLCPLVKKPPKGHLSISPTREFPRREEGGISSRVYTYIYI